VAGRPLLDAAAATGQLSFDHLRLLVKYRKAPVIDVFDRDEADLIAAAVELSVDGLRRHLERWYFDALAETGRNEPDGPEPAARPGNRFRAIVGVGGVGLIDATLDPVAFAALKARLDTAYDRLRASGVLENDPRTISEVYGDLFADLVSERPNGTNAIGARVSAVIDLDTLLRRAGYDDPDVRTRRRAEIIGTGPVSDDVIAELCQMAEIALLVTDRGVPLWFGRSRRLATRNQRDAVVAASDGYCEFPGCTVTADRCQIDHLQGWANGGGTDITNLGLACRFHNRLKHRRKLTVTRNPDGTTTWTQPDGTPITTHYHHTHPHPPDPPDPSEPDPP
jgi:hypothetical protein